MGRVLWAVLLCFVTQSFSFADASAGAKVKKVLFIGIDGCRFDAIEAARAPQLDKLIAEGAHSAKVKILAPRETNSDTISGPGWSSLLTGV